MKNNISLPTPCYVCEESLLEANLKILESIQNQTGIKILLALKAFAMHSTFDMCKKYLKCCCASGLIEAILAYEKFGLEVHTYSPAFKDNEFDKIAKISNHIIFNSHTQYDHFESRILAHNSIGFRKNPQYSSVKTDLYNPCAINSRLGITKNNFKAEYIDKIDGLHFHELF
jgi:carboxynorspermidine decarboxylase